MLYGAFNAAPALARRLHCRFYIKTFRPFAALFFTGYFAFSLMSRAGGARHHLYRHDEPPWRWA